jgi:preprotein translocase subunit YajC
VSIDGEECQIKGSHLELQDEDYVSSEVEEADTVMVPAGGEDGANGEEAEQQPVRRSVRLDPDFDEITGTRLVQKRVIIREGKLSGQIGKVASSGHGFYCVRARGVQVKLRRREFEVIEDDPSETMLSREAIENSNQPVELRGVASGSDNALVGKTCVVKLNGNHKGQTGVVTAYTYGIYSLNLHDPSDTKLLLLPEDLEVSTGKVDSHQAKAEEDAATNSQNGMRVAITSGKHDGRVGVISHVENGTYSIRFGNSEEVKVKSKEVEVLQASGDLPAGYESTPQMAKSDEKPVETIAEGHGKLLVGKHSGAIGKMVREEDGWCCVELPGSTEWARRRDLQTQLDVDQLAVEVEERPSGKGWKDKKVKVLYGLAAGQVATVSAVLEETMLVVNTDGAEVRVPVTNVELVPPEPKVVTQLPT